MIRQWRRLDRPGLELARIAVAPDGILVTSTLIDAGETPYALRYRWTLDSGWRTRGLLLERLDATGGARRFERSGPASWRVDGVPAPRLDGCQELDLSATPFCNALAIRRLDGEGDILCAWIGASGLSAQPSRQRYERLGPDTWRYVDLGVAEGFTAILRLDGDGLVASYEGLFEAF